MKLSNKLILLILVISNLIYGQARINKSQGRWAESYEKFTSATGWHQNSYGEWKSELNCLLEDYNYPPSTEDQYGRIIYYGPSEFTQHFYSLQIKTLIFNSKKYFVLIQKTKRRYCEIETSTRGYDCKPYPIFNVFLLEDSLTDLLSGKSTEFNKLNNILISNNEYTSINLLCVINGICLQTGPDATTESPDNYIKKEITKFLENYELCKCELSQVPSVSEYYHYEMQFKRAKNNEKKVIRFLLPLIDNDRFSLRIDSPYKVAGTWNYPKYFEIENLNKLTKLIGSN